MSPRPITTSAGTAIVVVPVTSPVLPASPVSTSNTQPGAGTPVATNPNDPAGNQAAPASSSPGAPGVAMTTPPLTQSLMPTSAPMYSKPT